MSQPSAILIYAYRWRFKTEIRTGEVAVPYTTMVPVLAAVQDDEYGQEEATTLISSTGMTCLRRIAGKGERTEEFMLDDSPLSIGSGVQADIKIKDKGISRFHARISREGEMIFIKDMNSTNGTWVNDRRLTVYELCPVRNGDIIRLAESRFELIDTSD